MCCRSYFRYDKFSNLSVRVYGIVRYTNDDPGRKRLVIYRRSTERKLCADVRTVQVF